MYQSKNPTTNNDTNNGPVFERPKVSLLNEEHWVYVRKQYYMSLRELQVAKLVCQGLNNEEIADNLKIKQGTIKTHIRNIYRRVRVKNRIEMLLRFVDNAASSPTKSQVNIPPLLDTRKPDITSI